MATGQVRFAETLLHQLGIAPNRQNVRALVGWQQAEGGHWNNDARFNPLNTTQPMHGAGNTGSQGNIKQYRDWGQGVRATARTLRNGNYGGILRALKSGSAEDVGQAIVGSPWGTKGLVLQTIGQTGAVRPTGQLLVNAAGGRQRGNAGALMAADGGAQGGSGLPAGGEGTLALLQALSAQQQPQPAASGGLQAPSFSAAPTLPTGAPAVQPTSGGPAPKMDTVALLSAVQSQSADVGGTLPPALTPGEPDSLPGSHGGGVDAALSWASSKLGFKEQGENHGPLADRLNKQFGFSGAPWCAMFTSAAVTRGGAPKSARTASVAQVREKAMAGTGYERGLVGKGDVQAGDLILFGNSHIGMVQAVHGDRVRYIGGNQSDGVTIGHTTRSGGDFVRPLYGARKRGR